MAFDARKASTSLDARQPCFMKTPLLSLLAVAGVFALAPVACHAVVLTSYNFGTNSSLVYTASSTAEGITATAISRGSGVTFARSGVNFDGSSQASALGIWQQQGSLVSSLNAAIDAQKWITLTITPDADKAVTLTSLTFHANIGSATTAADTVAVQISIGGGSYETYGNAVTIAGVSGTDGSNSQLYTVSFPGGSGLADITESVTVRLLFYNTSASESAKWQGFTRLDDITLHGTVGVIPEPAVAASFAGLAGLGVAFFSRRRRR